MIVPDELSRSTPAFAPKPAERLMDGGHDKGSFDGGWMGMVNEFRNQLTIFLAGTNQLSAMLPRAVASEFADRLDDMESSVEFLQTLLTWMDASIGTWVAGHIGRWGSAASGRDVGVHRSVFAGAYSAGAAAGGGEKPRRRRRVRAGGSDHRARSRVGILVLADRTGTPHTFEVTVSVHPQRGTLSILLTSEAAQPPEGGWRVSLAKALLTQVGGTVDTLAGAAAGATMGARSGFDVRFRFQYGAHGGRSTSPPARRLALTGPAPRAKPSPAS